MGYLADEKRYERMTYQRAGRSGLLLPKLSLGLWHNFGSVDRQENMREILLTAFDHGVTHFDLANNYGPVPGSAEENFGRIFKNDLKPYRDEMIISTKAGYDMWPGPYGTRNGSRKYLLASLDQSLKRMGLDYVDIFYHHCPDSETPIEESMQALTDAVRQGKALYVAISNYRSKEAKEAFRILRENKTPCVLHQPSYNMLDRWVEEDGLLDLLTEEGVGCICYSPLAQGLLTDRYKDGIPEDSRAARDFFLKKDRVTKPLLQKLQALRSLAEGEGITLANLALLFCLRKPALTSVLVGASKKEQLLENLRIVREKSLSPELIQKVEEVLEKE